VRTAKVIALIVGVAAIVGTSFLVLRWMEGRMGVGGFLSGVLAGLLMSGALLVTFARHIQRQASIIRKEGRQSALPDAGVPAGETAVYHWNVKRLDGTLVSIDEVMREVVFLNFWSTMCLPCVKELASIERLHAKLAPEGIVFMCVATDQDLEKLRMWLADHAVSIPVFSLATDELPRVFDSEYLPATYLLAPDGRIAFKHEGAARWDHPRVIAFLRGLLMESAIIPAIQPPSSSTPKESS
jgi:thiol-disulfide isomerase/thioredoxin